MTHYIISSQREGRFFVKQVTMEKPVWNPEAWDMRMDFEEAEDRYKVHEASAPEFLIEGSVTGKIGDEILGSLKSVCLRCGDKLECGDSKCEWPKLTHFVPRSASTVEPDKNDNMKNISVGDKCLSKFEGVLRNAVVTKVDTKAETYDVDIVGIGIPMYNIPFSIWQPVESGVEPESKGEETDWIERYELLRRTHNMPDSIKKIVQEVSDYTLAKASLQQPTYSREQVLELLRKITEEAFQVDNYDVWEVMVEGKLKKYSSEKLLDKFFNP